MAIAQITVDAVSKQYAQTKAVNNLSLAVNKGEIFALLGPNGAGKSSLVRMLIGFTLPDSGSIQVHINDQSYSHIPKQCLGYLPEDRGLYPEKSVSKNLLYFAKLRGVNKSDALSRIDYWLEKFDLLERKDDPLKSLSKGNQQKVQLITAVLHEPEIVLLDEPFSGLDPVNQEKVVQFLSELKNKGMTVILSAHQMAMVEKLADRMLLMNLGQAVLYGSLNEIRNQTIGEFEVSIQFANPIESSQLQGNKFNAILSADNQITVQLPHSSDLSGFCQYAATIDEITNIQSKQQDLHQLYLQAVANDVQLQGNNKHA